MRRWLKVLYHNGRWGYILIGRRSSGWYAAYFGGGAAKIKPVVDLASEEDAYTSIYNQLDLEQVEDIYPETPASLGVAK